MFDIQEVERSPDGPDKDSVGTFAAAAGTEDKQPRRDMKIPLEMQLLVVMVEVLRGVVETVASSFVRKVQFLDDRQTAVEEQSLRAEKHT